MYRNISILTLFGILFFSCASTPKTAAPDWVNSDWRKSFPEDKYISMRAIANTPEEVKSSALSEIAMYINTNVNTNLRTSFSGLKRGGEIIDEQTFIANESEISSQVQLFGVEFTEPYYQKHEKKWYGLAYINREKAWEQYVPKIEDARNTFYEFYDVAQTENEPIYILGYYKKSLEKGKDFLKTLEYGRLINPKKEREFEKDRQILAKIPSLIETEQNYISVQIEINGDYNAIIETSIEKAFKDAGFTVSPNGNHLCNVKIEHNSDGKNPLAIFPSIDLKLFGIEKKAVLSYRERITERTVAYSLETAQKKGYPKLAKKIESQLSEELKNLKK